jgi:hypothetical protein
VDYLRFLSPSATPGFGRDLFTSKQRATSGFVIGLALVQRAVVAGLASGVFGVFGFVGFGSVDKVAQRFGLGVGFGNHRRCLGRSEMGGGQRGGGGTALNHKLAAAGHGECPDGWGVIV